MMTKVIELLIDNTLADGLGLHKDDRISLLLNHEEKIQRVLYWQYPITIQCRASNQQVQLSSFKLSVSLYHL